MSAGLGAGWLRHPLLEVRGVAHGFGTRACRAPDALRRPRQVHGTHVVRIAREGALPDALGEADAVVSARPGLPVGVVTADCLPILVASPSGVVAAVHAGWRGLAAGVIAAAIEVLADEGGDRRAAVAVIGPHVGWGCYEVDAPVVDALAQRFGDALGSALSATRPGHWRLELARLARVDLLRAGLDEAAIGVLPEACTACDASRFHSYRRDGPRSGRLVHWVAAAREARWDASSAALDTPAGPA